MSKIKNILIFLAIAAAFGMTFFYFTRPSSDQELISSGNAATSPDSGSETTANSSDGVAQNFLTLLLSVKTIKLDDSIFSDSAFASLHDSSITLIPDATIGRPNPFAQFGSDNVAASTTPVASATPVVPPVTVTAAASDTSNISDTSAASDTSNISNTTTSTTSKNTKTKTKTTTPVLPSLKL
jgi:hypothetical protein